MNRGLRGLAGLGIAVVAMLAMASAASAANISIGQTAPAGTSGNGCSGCTLFQGTTGSASPSYVTPVNGVITSWSVQAQSGGCNSGCTARLRVFRSLPGNTFEMVAETTDQNIDAGLKTFPASIAVLAGDRIGIEGSNGVRFYSGQTGDVVDFMVGDPALNTPFGACGSSPCYFTSEGNSLVNVSAVVQTSLAVASVSASCGAAAGGGSVTISGAGFTGATAVKFNGVNAQSFTVVSDTQIVAKAPAGTAGQAVDITVTAPGGTSQATLADRCTYDVLGLPKAGLPPASEPAWRIGLAAAAAAIGMAGAAITLRRPR
ncbi:MAG TPA: IPT/TIG domain-containing protein [Candidatus Dormibacteraeota bacterium]|nr:IPT/TIG domain-containing protein [Candidatus Dormibacteraeota bacterium]